MSVSILRINTAGRAIEWLSWQAAVCLHARDLVSWTYGEEIMAVKGGYCRLTGQQSALTLNSIIACRGKVIDPGRSHPPLTKKALFRRDQHVCLYCGQLCIDAELSRDHVKPLSRGGLNCWTNVVSACRRCNARKGNAEIETLGIQLLALPYMPNHAEYLALSHSGRILGDQMLFLKRQFPAQSRLLPENQHALRNLLQNPHSPSQ
jgi:hypothetical protein